MVDEVKTCVDAKINCITEYFSVPSELEDEVSSFFADTTALGESCSSAVDFEEKFVSTGLVERFNAIFPKCQPKRKKLTKEEKKDARKMTKEVFLEHKEDFAEAAADSAMTMAGNALEHKKGEWMDENRKRMIENGTFDDYAIGSNRVNDAFRLGSFVKNLFKK